MCLLPNVGLKGRDTAFTAVKFKLYKKKSSSVYQHFQFGNVPDTDKFPIPRNNLFIPVYNGYTYYEDICC